MRRRSRILAVVAVTVAITAGPASAAIKEPHAVVSATFDLVAQQPYVQGACPGPNFYDALYAHLLGTETDSSTPPHPELTGNLEANVTTYLDATGQSQAAAGTIVATLTDDAGNVLYSGRGTFAGMVNAQGHVVGSGVLQANLSVGGQRTNHLLIAGFTLDQRIDNFNITGQFGNHAAVGSYGIETAGVCPATSP